MELFATAGFALERVRGVAIAFLAISDVEGIVGDFVNEVLAIKREV